MTRDPSEIQLSIGALAETLVRISGAPREITFRPEFLRYETRPIERFDLSAPLRLGWRPRIDDLAVGLATPSSSTRS